MMRSAVCLFLLVAMEAALASESTLEFIVHFATGPNWQVDVAPAQQPGFDSHSANLGRLRREGSITFGARYEGFGVIFLKAGSIEAARAILDDDPGVKAGIFVYTIAPLNVFYPYRDQVPAASS